MGKRSGMDFRTRFLVWGVVVALLVPLVLVVLGVRRWFRSMEELTEGKDHYVTVCNTQVQGRDDSIPLPKGTTVRLYRSRRNNQVWERTLKGKGKCVYVRFHTPDGHSSRGYVPWEHLKEKDAKGPG